MYSAKREDYTNLVDITNLVAEFANKHIETRWLSMKYVAVRILEQWVNLKEYFLTFLSKHEKTLTFCLKQIDTKHF